MAKKSIINRQLKRQKIVARYKNRREKLLDIAGDLKLSDDERFEARQTLQKLPRDAAPTRLRNRCQITGRPRGVYRKFGIARTKIRELAMAGLIPGVVKSSW
jgi:small subunit ribosomal protein S14